MSCDRSTSIGRVEDAAVAVIGAGSIGVGWSIVFARAGHHVTLYDPDANRLRESEHDLDVRLRELKGHDLLDEPVGAVASRVRRMPRLIDALEDVRYVQECAPESVDVKRNLFARLDELAPTTAVLASSSSAIPASRFASNVPGRARVLVAHPGNPPYLLPIVELVPAPFTDSTVTDWTDALLRDAEMAPVIVHDEPIGFVFNRLQGAVLREAYCLVRDGVIDVDGIDSVMRNGLGRRWAILGPFETVDLNTRGGIAVHAGRMGPGYREMGRERGQDDPWTPELVAKVTAQRRAELRLEEWQDRVLWRDEALMTMNRCRREFE